MKKIINYLFETIKKERILLTFIIILFILGLVFGSFYNVVGYRLPNNMSIVFPASHCTNCNHKLKFYELKPVISYIFLGG